MKLIQEVFSNDEVFNGKGTGRASANQQTADPEDDPGGRADGGQGGPGVPVPTGEHSGVCGSAAIKGKAVGQCSTAFPTF